jgi:hypothetical protein
VTGIRGEADELDLVPEGGFAAEKRMTRRGRAAPGRRHGLDVRDDGDGRARIVDEVELGSRRTVGAR